MATRPHDLTDLYLAPVVLTVDARIAELGRLDQAKLAYKIATGKRLAGLHPRV